MFGTLTPGGLTQVSGEAGTGSQQATFNAMNQFMGVMTDDPFSAGGNPNAYAGEKSLAYARTRQGPLEERTRRQCRRVHQSAADSAFLRAALERVGGGLWRLAEDGRQYCVGIEQHQQQHLWHCGGSDYRLSPYTLAGFALAGGGTNFNVANNLGTGRSDLFQAGAFIRHNAGAAYLSGALAYGWQDITTNRTVTVAGIDQLRAQFNANAWSGRVEGGYRFVSPWIGMGIAPYAAGQFTAFDLPAYAEQALVGSNAFALAYGSKSVTATRSELGLRSDKSFAMQDGIFTLRGRAAWAHDFNIDRVIGATFQTLPGASFVVNDAALVTASAEKKWLNGWSAAVTFEREFSKVTTSYAGGVVRYSW